MKSKKFIVAGEILAVLFLSGCVTRSSNFEIPPPKVELKKNPSVKISTVGDAAMLKYLAAGIGAEFKKNGGKVVDTNPDYWIVIYGVQDRRVDTPADNEYNVIFSKIAKKDANGGEEFIVKRKFTTTADAKFASIVLYDVKTLTPIVNMDFPFYSSSITAGPKSKKLRSDKEMAASFARLMNRIIFNDGSDVDDEAPDARPKSQPRKKAPAPKNGGATSGFNVGGGLINGMPKLPFGK